MSAFHGAFEMCEALPEEATLTESRLGLSKQRGPGRFGVKILLFFSPIIVLLAAVELVLWRTGETWTIQRVIEAQHANTNVLFMRGILDQGFYRYKFLQFEQQHPKVLVLGSSRVMQFRKEMFGSRSKDFFNAGGMIQDLSDLYQFAQRLAPTTAPKVIILGLDLWWFNGSKPLLEGLNAGIARDAALDWQEHARAFRRFKSSKSRSPVLKALRAQNQNIGIEARAAGVGFRPDGSMQYNFESPQATAWKFVDRENPPVAERIRNNSAQFTPTSGVSPERIELLGKCLDIFRSKNILVLGFCPPFSSEAAALLQASASQSNFWSETRAQIRKKFQDWRLPFVDASLLSDLGANDSVMIDGLHAAETFHLTLLLRFLSDVRAASAFPDLRNSIGAALKSPTTDPWHPDYQPFSKVILYRGARE